jgi:hypothetical protein
MLRKRNPDEGFAMSLPDEKARAVRYTREWLFKLLDRKYQPKISEVRAQACRLLRHYPWGHDLDVFLKALERQNRRSSWKR